MTDTSTLRWARPEPGDNPAWADLLDAIEAVDERGEILDAEDLVDEWESVWAHPETDSVFVWDGDEMVAFGWLKTIPGEREVHRVELWGGVRPSHRRRGIGTELMRRQLERASEIAATLEGLPVRAEVAAADHQADLAALAESFDFRPARRFLEVARPTAEPLVPAAAPDGLELVEWGEAIDDAVRRAHADSFSEHWGSEPRTAEEWRQWYTGHRYFRPDLSRIAVDRATGEVASFVLTAAYPQDWERTPVEAWINTVGTVRAWRGRGAGQWLMTEVLGLIRASHTGFERAILGVDSDNVTGALRLYRRLGFEDVRAVNTLTRRLWTPAVA